MDHPFFAEIEWRSVTCKTQEPTDRLKTYVADARLDLSSSNADVCQVVAKYFKDATFLNGEKLQGSLRSFSTLDTNKTSSTTMGRKQDGGKSSNPKKVQIGSFDPLKGFDYAAQQLMHFDLLLEQDADQDDETRLYFESAV